MGACYGNDKKYSTNGLDAQKDQENEITNPVLHNNIPGQGKMCDETCQYIILINNWVCKKTPIDNVWKKRMVSVKAEDVTTSELLEIKNNSLSLPESKYVLTFDVFANIEDNPEEFHEHYQEKQEQHLEQLNTQLCQYCLILCDFQYCNECDLIYNPLIYMIYMIPKEDEPINNCTLELESIFNPNSNFNNNDDKNNGFSSAQNNNKNNNNLDSDSNPKTFITLSDLTKKQELKWFSNNDKSIMPEHMHNTDARFDLRYSEKDVIKLEPHLHTNIDLKEINFRKGIIDAGYIRNIIAMLQYDLKKAYIIEPNEKIAQTIFLPLVKVAQLVLVRNRKELEITAREIQRFGSTSRIDVPVNMAEEKIMRRMLSAPTRTIGTDELGKLRSTTTYAVQDITQQFQ
ncbi:hypothetical protein G9A89_010383 [Geosiphon pyriformis]|nr:hypothetical protein G9A89_010383 [Geosiphon pyriformis]